MCSAHGIDAPGRAAGITRRGTARGARRPAEPGTYPFGSTTIVTSGASPEKTLIATL